MPSLHTRAGTASTIIPNNNKQMKKAQQTPAKTCGAWCARNSTDRAGDQIYRELA